VIINASQFTPCRDGWFISSSSGVGLEIKIPDLGGAPNATALAQANLFLEHRATVEPPAKAFLVHHVRFTGDVHLAGVEVLAERDRHGASLVLTYLNDDDRHLWIGIGMAPGASCYFQAKYAFVKYW
jgi:hypothetical protein